MSLAKKKVIALVAVIMAAITLLVLAAAGVLPGLTARAATAGSTQGIGYYVRAILPHNQIDDTLTYFDLRMQPGQTQQLEVEVVNETNTPITVDLAAISASTNRNGIIDYKTPDIRDVTLQHPFSDLARWEQGSLHIAANATATACITVTMPAAQYDGVVLGGLVFTRQPESDGAGSGTGLQNIYSYVVGVKLSETDTTVLPDFELDSVQAETVNYQPAMVHTIRNKTAAIAKGITINAVVTGADGTVVAKAERRDVDMAPNSVMPLALEALSPDGSTAGGPLAPGHYTSTVTLEKDGETWTLEQPFTIGQAEADTVNTAMPGSALQPAQNHLLVILLLVGAGVIILALLVIILLLVARRRREKEQARQARQLRRPQPPQQRTLYRQKHSQ